MTKSKIRSLCINATIVSVCAIVFVIRWQELPHINPHHGSDTYRARVTLLLTDNPIYTDVQTNISKGLWKITLKGYHSFDLGHRYVFEGTVTPRYLWGKEVAYTMDGDTVEVDTHIVETRLVDRMLIVLSLTRTYLLIIFDRGLPSPMSNLASGLLLGVTGQMPPSFMDNLIKTGTLHIVAASGYNVTIVAQTFLALFVPLFGKSVALAASIVVILCYVLLAGGSPAVVRAAFMGSFTLIAYYWGRPTDARRLLWIASGVMLIMSPQLIVSPGFQLSVAATAGLLYIEPVIRRWGSRLVAMHSIQAYLSEYLYPTLAATLATLPILAWTFGRVSWIAPVVNMMVLPIVPLAMFLSLVMLLTSFIPGLSLLVAALTYTSLWYMIRVITLFGSLL